MAFLQHFSGPASLVMLALALLLAAVVHGHTWRTKRSSLPLPPGPPAEPILGHLRIIPPYNPEYRYMQWSKDYGSDILSLSVLGQPVIVLNSVRAAVDLLAKRGANYCDRPRFVLFEVMGWVKTLTFLRNGPEFRIHRSILQKSFRESSIRQYQGLQERETTVLLRGILNTPAKWETVLRRFATAVVLGIGFGIKIERDDDPFIQIAADASYALGHGGVPAGTPVDFFPFLKVLPRFFHDRSLKFAADWRGAIRALHDKPFDAVMASKERTRSLMQQMLDQRDAQIGRGEKPELSHEDIKGAAATVFAAGQDTIYATLVVFLLNMILHPDVQTKARRLIDEVVGRDRVPSFQDRPRLPYIDLIVQETLRWCPVSPLGVPHRSLEDDVYDGYFIPAGSLVYANARAMTHDESTYADPENFNPDRYVSRKEGGLGEPFPIGQFGYGRRVCIGKHLAEASVWIVVASILSTMNIEKARDERGRDIEPKVEFTFGLTSHPKPFPCRFVPRDERAAQVVRQFAHVHE
ncbi:O-methylsterigmatocystin oxidoreductase [Drechmeria coniospora]|uniref:O-methylsterigmatocystin oxidoreductase n=1 Tax=Drechmeria coniospora TaxID=98403 RepID=A0A151GLJ3_DRECN|nr:O-methylsterigmatocystin oxidoreductase [Drechmeria coniospora]KYK57872.1 O-methylsterigmatocystin oxidoreductase [Drechmeria coniospora]ODA83287.1 hypothetical protein RJ55_01799 [Drechmeria coniospora]